MTIATQESLKSIARDFTTVKATVDAFVKWTNENIEERKEGTDIEVEAALPMKEQRRKKVGPERWLRMRH